MEKIETLAEASAYLEGLINRERQPSYAYSRLDLAPIEALLAELGDPHKHLSVLHVAGSKGKGSTCLFAESIFLSLGQSVGTFTSPHLDSWVERFRLNGESIEPGHLARVVNQIRPVVDALRDGPEKTRPSFFDATTAIAFLVFAEASVERAIIEVGLGGRLDSTNVVAPRVTCITSIELEHTDKLGDTEAKIAGEKAGILKPSRPAVLGFFRPEAEAVIRERAVNLGAPIRALGEAFIVEAIPEDHEPAPFPKTGQAMRFRGVVSTNEASDDTDRNPASLQPTESEFVFDAELAMSGRPALLNAGLAIECVRAFGDFDDAEVAEAAKMALARRRLPGRIEILKGDPQVVVDAAHTVESARALATALQEIAPDGFDLLLSVSGDKNLDGVLDAILPRARRVMVTKAEPSRSMPAEALALEVRQRRPEIVVEVIEDPEEATRRARSLLASDGRLCATGSTYLAGVVRRVLLQEHPA